MKKLWLVFGLLVFAGACSDKQEEQNPENLPLEEVLEEGEQVVVRPNFDIKFEEETYIYKFGESQAGCDKGSDVVCAIDLYAKCTLDPKGSECDKKKMPKFVFMDDESLQRPTEMRFKIVKIKPVDANMIEVYTQGSCNGMWFGLCEGNIIYVLSNKNGFWAVKDVYARENF